MKIRKIIHKNNGKTKKIIIIMIRIRIRIK